MWRTAELVSYFLESIYHSEKSPPFINLNTALKLGNPIVGFLKNILFYNENNTRHFTWVSNTILTQDMIKLLNQIETLYVFTHLHSEDTWECSTQVSLDINKHLEREWDENREVKWESERTKQRQKEEWEEIEREGGKCLGRQLGERPSLHEWQGELGLTHILVCS